jgi:hypothetical protein
MDSAPPRLSRVACLMSFSINRDVPLGRNFTNKRKAALETKPQLLWQKCISNLITVDGVEKASFSLVPGVHQVTVAKNGRLWCWCMIKWDVHTLTIMEIVLALTQTLISTSLYFISLGK